METMPESLSQSDLVLLVAVAFSAVFALAAAMGIWCIRILIRACRIRGDRAGKSGWVEPAFESGHLRDRIEKIRHNDLPEFEDRTGDALQLRHRVSDARSVIRTRSYFEHE